MEAAGLDLLVCYTDAQHSMGGPIDSVRWLSGFKAMAESVLLLPRDDEPTLLVTPAWDVGRARRRSVIDRIVEFRQLEVSKTARVGFVGGARCTRERREALASDFESIDFDREFADLTKIRDELEIRNVIRATEVAEQAYDHMLAYVRPGLREHQMVGELSAHLRSLGADDNFLLVAASRQHAAIRVPGDRILDAGDVILGEISPSIDGDFSQICKTAVLGGPSSVQRDRFELLVESLHAGLRTGRSGVTVSETVRAMNEPLVREGFGDYCRQPFMRARGHGLGMGSRAPGDISADNETVLEAGMLFVIHPNQFLPGSGYLMVGAPVVVTADGLRPLTQRQPSLDAAMPR